MEKFDIVVIGAGPGGYPAAIRAAQLGASVAVVEKEHLGGTCLNWGCIPTKTLIASSDLFAHIRHAGAFGIKAPEPSFNYAAMVKRKDEVVGKLRGGIGQLFKGNGITLFQGAASFLDRHRIAVCGAKGETAIGADKVIVATGSTSAIPRFFPESDRILDSRRFLDLTSLPKSLVVVGGGVIGCEFACMAGQLGREVTVVELLEDILMVVDPDIRKELRRQMESLGVRVLTGQPIEDVAATKSSVSGRVGEETIRAEMMLVSIGRRPVTDGLELPKADVAVTDAGYVEVDEYCRTTAASVYAIGDVNGGPQLAHAATSQGITAAENALRPTRSPRNELVPACIFTSPEIGSVGLTEDAAREQGRKINTGKFGFAALGKAMASGQTDGFVKWVADAETDQLLGGHAIGAHATELIAEAAVAIQAELTVAELGRTVHCHPTLSESWMEAAHALHGECIHAPPRRKRG